MIGFYQQVACKLKMPNGLILDKAWRAEKTWGTCTCTCKSLTHPWHCAVLELIKVGGFQKFACWPRRESMGEVSVNVWRMKNVTYQRKMVKFHELEAPFCHSLCQALSLRYIRSVMHHHEQCAPCWDLGMHDTYTRCNPVSTSICIFDGPLATASVHHDRN